MPSLPASAPEVVTPVGTPSWTWLPGPGRPVLATLARTGDGFAATALVVQGVGGIVAHTALAALLEARLRAAGIPAEGRADQDGFRLVVTSKEDETSTVIRALSEAVLRPIGEADAAGLKLVSARVRALRIWLLPDKALEDFAACAGDPALLPGTDLPLLDLPEHRAQVESWRARILASRSALGVVGSLRAVQAAQEASRTLSGWPEGEPTPLVPPLSEAPPVVVGELGPPPGGFRVSVAAWFPEVDAAPRVAGLLGAPGAAVGEQLQRILRPARLQRVIGVARKGGSCVLVNVEAEAAGGRGIPEDAALIATLLRREIAALHRSREPLLPPEDPRVAAVAGAWWALTRGAPSLPGKPVFRVALRVAPREGSSLPTEHFKQVLQDLQERPPALEIRSVQEQGQGRLWALVASPCPLTEPPAEHGITALSLLARLPGGVQTREGVALEPWLEPDGVGVLAWTTPRLGETPAATGERLAEAIGRTLLGAPPSAGAIQEARGMLLGRLASSEQLPGELWAVLAPEQPGRMWVGGSVDGIARPGVEAVRQRWTRLTAGPLRAALLFEHPEQREAWEQGLIRWLPPVQVPTGCVAPPLDPLGSGGAMLRESNRAYLAWRIDASGAGAGYAAVAALLLGEPGRVLASTLEGSGVTGRGWVVGKGAEAGLVVELRGAKEALEGAIVQSRGLFERLEAQGEAWTRASARWRELEREKRLSPRGRLAALWSGEDTILLEEDGWMRWSREQLAASRAVVLRPKQ
ncbi:MAG: hypothetical protein RMJ98_06755 [Myxococcales bacterium]|nr:hypothetical protein [Polyangiaceae bacterium]MDW8248985.1 hypothetical protein [Myxococcales bacterium]